MNDVAAPLAQNESDRLHALANLGLLDTPHEERFDRFTRLARRVFQVPVALVSLVDQDRQWFKSNQGLDVDETPRDVSFCDHAIRGKEPFIVLDASQDPTFRDNPLVTGAPGIRFYAGFPLSTTDGFMIGTLCIIDYEPRLFTTGDIEMLTDFGRMVESEIQLLNLATIDDLTGLSNRRGFLGIAVHAIAMCQRLRRPATLMYFDLDRFKEVNDNHGHAEGDKVLRDISQLLLQEFRHSDVIARLGGDEFCVLLTDAGGDDVARPLRNLQRAMDEESERNPYSIGCSVGVVEYDPDRHPVLDDLMAEADQLMYEQKKRKGAAR